MPRIEKYETSEKAEIWEYEQVISYHKSAEKQRITDLETMTYNISRDSKSNFAILQYC